MFSRANSPPDFPEGAAIVVGGSGGVGRAICEALAYAGADVALTYRNNAEAAEGAAEAVRGAGRAAEVHALSLEDDAAVARFVEQVAARFGRVHTVVNAAGADIKMQFVHDISPAEWRGVLDRDANGFFNLVHCVLPLLRASRGSLVAVTSAGLKRYPAKDLLSVAPKAAIDALVRAVASEEGRFGVRANSVALGVIDTGIFHRLKGQDAEGLPPAWVTAAQRNTAMKRFGTAREVAEAVVFLASARASYVTGQTLVLDGGYSI